MKMMGKSAKKIEGEETAQTDKCVEFYVFTFLWSFFLCVSKKKKKKQEKINK